MLYQIESLSRIGHSHRNDETFIPMREQKCQRSEKSEAK